MAKQKPTVGKRPNLRHSRQRVHFPKLAVCLDRAEVPEFGPGADYQFRTTLERDEIRFVHILSLPDTLRIP